jgi:hypothetical protein
MLVPIYALENAKIALLWQDQSCVKIIYQELKFSCNDLELIKMIFLTDSGVNRKAVIYLHIDYPRSRQAILILGLIC